MLLQLKSDAIRVLSGFRTNDKLDIVISIIGREFFKAAATGQHITTLLRERRRRTTPLALLLNANPYNVFGILPGERATQNRDALCNTIGILCFSCTMDFSHAKQRLDSVRTDGHASLVQTERLRNDEMLLKPVR